MCLLLALYDSNVNNIDINLCVHFIPTELSLSEFFSLHDLCHLFFLLGFLFDLPSLNCPSDLIIQLHNSFSSPLVLSPW